MSSACRRCGAEKATTPRYYPVVSSERIEGDELPRFSLCISCMADIHESRCPTCGAHVNVFAGGIEVAARVDRTIKICAECRENWAVDPAEVEA